MYGSYEGEWYEDSKNGRGKWQSSVGEKYDGVWDMDLKHGSGTWVWEVLRY